MTNNYQNITDNPDNYGTARFISWGLMIPSFVAYALLTWCYFEDPEMLTKLSKNKPVASGEAKGASALPVFDRTVNPISNREADYAHYITTFPSGFLDLPTAL